MAKFVYTTKRRFARAGLKLSGALLALLGIRTLSSCGVYFPPVAMYMPAPVGLITGTVTGDSDQDPTTTAVPIPGIRIVAQDGSLTPTEAQTDTNGSYWLQGLASGNVTITFSDIDGSENGSWQEKIEVLQNYEQFDNMQLNVELENVPSSPSSNKANSK